MEFLNRKKRDEIISKLSKKQSEFISIHLKRGRKTVFANVLAKEKASSVNQNIENVAQKWDLLDYLDAGPSWQIESDLYCECGRTLRYQYIVQNLETREIKKFGINHFEEHTGILAHLVRDIINGIDRIDYEMDEILTKIVEGWSLEEEGIIEIPENIQIPKDIQDHITSEVPLLKRQVMRLKNLIGEHIKTREIEQNLLRNHEKVNFNSPSRLSSRKKIEENKIKWGKYSQNNIVELDQKLQQGTIRFIKNLQKLNFSAIEVCYELIENYGAPKDTFLSGRPLIYPDVCIFLDYLSEKGIVQSVGTKWVNDRSYKRLKGENQLSETKPRSSQLTLFE